MDREALEKRAAELKLKFPSNIGDEKLAKKITDEEAKRADIPPGGDTSKSDDETEGGSTSSNEGADDQSSTPSENTTEDDADQSLGSQSDESSNDDDVSNDEAGDDDAAGDPDESEIVVICNVASGRRRAGRRWPGGKTTIKVSDLTDEQAEELEADPMFHFKRPD